MPGIYIHIPFCKQACHYCNFHFSTQLTLQQPLLAAIHQEIILRKGYLGNVPINTIYFGGGTPSILPVEEIKKLLGAIYANFEVADDAEITLEANPDDLTKEKLLALKAAGINRLSIGIQSFREEDLKFMNRAHNAVEAEQCVKYAHEAGFDNISIDLIYGTPSMDENAWIENLQKAIALKVPHLSAYCLTVEPKTALDSFVKKGTAPPIDEALAERHFQLLLQHTAQAGYEHYEISNFALPNHYSRHNTSYWTGAHYLGLGPSAHSFNGTHRQWNVANNPQYIKAVTANAPFSEEEELSIADQYNEYLMTSLRTMWGADLELIEKRFGEEYLEQLEEDILPALLTGYIEKKGNHLILSASGKFLADGIISDLFEVED